MNWILAAAVNGDLAYHAGKPAWWLLGLFALMTTALAWVASRHFYIKKEGRYEPAFTALQIFSCFLLFGTLVAQFWAHGDPEGYGATMHAVLAIIGGFTITPHFLINDGFMTLFFGIAAKELSEALLKKGGALRGMQGVLPMVACAGGVIGPAVAYCLLSTPDMRNAWAVPCATDIAFAWLGARTIWGPKHPAVLFLLALAIGDDFVGMGIIAAFYPQHEFHVSGAIMIVAGMAIAYAFKRSAVTVPVFRSWLVYMPPAILCWVGLLFAGLHAALALVFVVPFMPMKGRDEGIFAAGESGHHHDTINAFEHALKPSVDVGLFYFGLANAGVAWLGQSTWNQDSWAVFLGLGIGKTVGITAFTIVGYVVLRMVGKAQLPVHPETGVRMQWRDVPVVGVLGAMGFTVALFVADAAGGAPSLKVGALASFFYLGLAILIGKVVCRKEVPRKDSQATECREPEEVVCA